MEKTDEMKSLTDSRFFRRNANEGTFNLIHNDVKDKDLSLPEAKQKLQEVMDKMIERSLLTEDQQDLIKKLLNEAEFQDWEKNFVLRTTAELLFFVKMYDDYKEDMETMEAERQYMIENYGGLQRGGRRRKRNSKKKKRKSKRRSKKSKRHSKRR